MSRKLPGNVKALGAVSFLTDVSSEMIYPLVPVFLSGVLGASAAFVGVIEGAAEAVAAMLKVLSGKAADRMSRRKPLVVAGYVISSLVRPLVAFATAASQVLAIRVADRVGKGIRTPPRDALLAASAAATGRGRAFGFHRASDNLGAVVGPLVATAILAASGAALTATPSAETARAIRLVFLAAAIPAALAVITLVVAVRDVPVAARSEVGQSPISPRLPGRLKAFLAILFLFALGNSTDAFLLLRASQLGVATAAIPALWALLHVVKTAGNTWGGAMSDRFGRRPLLIAGWLAYALVYAGFALASSEWHAWALFAAYGIYYALTEGAERAFVADVIASPNRGAAYGWYNAVTGIAALPASLLFGLIWDRFGAPVAFLAGGALALAAAALLFAFRSDPVPAS